MQWPSISPLKIVSHKEGYFVFLMRSKEDLRVVLEGGPYYINRQPVLVYE